jgi:3-oxoacyl-[acyl-carrier-protein] synthase-3
MNVESNMSINIGIASFAAYLPAGRITSAELAAGSGIPEEVVREKFGIHQKTKAGPHENPSEMALLAAQRCLQSAQFPPSELDAIIYFGSEYKDHYVWSLTTWLIEQLGAKRAMGFDMYAVCTGLIVSMKTAQDMMRGNPELQNVLLVGASRESDLLDYGDQLSRFIFNFADGAGAVLLRREHPANVILSTDFVFDGRFSRSVQVPFVGTRPFAQCRSFVSSKPPAFVVNDPEKMKEQLDPISVPNFEKVIRGALEKCGRTPGEVDFLGLLHAKRSFFLGILESVGIPEEKTLYARDYGHVQALDPLIALERAEKMNKLKAGDLVVLASAGAGYSWGAAVLHWGKME